MLLVATLVPAEKPTAPVAVAPPWPAGVPEPHFGKDELVARLNLRGASARAMVHAVPHPDQARWPVFRLSDGRRAQVSWRYLLPHE